MVAPVGARVPDPDGGGEALAPYRTAPDAIRRALDYMDLAPDTPIGDIRLDRVFIGSCTNSRIEDLRAAAAVIGGRRVAASVRQAMVVPGSGLVKRQAEEEGLDKSCSARRGSSGASRAARCAWR